MKIAAGRFAAFVRQPDPAARLVLAYGPDAGQVKETLDAVARTVLADLNDPFRVAELTPATIKADPARLADEAAALALTGGRRVVRIRDGDDSLAGALGRLLTDPAAEALVLVAAGELAPRSALRKLAEDAPNAAALACYGDEGRGLESVIAGMLAEARLTADPDAMAYLCARLGGDRQLTRREVEKLALYAMPAEGGPGRVHLADALACIGDSTELDLEDLAFAAADGDLARLDRIMGRLLAEGTGPVAILRAAIRHFQRLHLAAGLMATGRSAEQAMAALKPKVFYKREASFRAQLGAWPAGRLARALSLLLEAEVDCKTTGLPHEDICGRAMMQIARARAAKARK